MDMHPKPPRSLLRQTGRALVDYAMLRDGDRVLLAVSGGKDSLSLLALLRHFQRHAPLRFELGAITVDPLVEGFDPSHLIPYMAALGVPYLYIREPLMERARAHMTKDSYCAWCSRMKRGIIYTQARNAGYNVIALGQHLDDLAESFLMSAFRGGRLNTMKAHYLNDAGDLRIIRPLVYVRERQTRDYAQTAALPVVPDSCPACFAMPTERARIKALLAEEELGNRSLFANLLSSMRPLMRRDLPPGVTLAGRAAAGCVPDDAAGAGEPAGVC